MTRQVGDFLIYEGKEQPLLSTIHLPENNPSIVKLSDDEFKSLFVNLKKDNFDTYLTSPLIKCHSTACWRQYIAIWEVKYDVLYLKSISGRYKLVSETPIIVDWYTNTMKTGVGKVLD